MRCLLTGAHGLLGQDVRSVWTDLGHDVDAMGHAELDIRSADAVAAAVDPSYDVVINCAAYTAVDDAEEHENEAFAVNALGPAVLARGAAACGVRIVHLSTDYVFDGQASEPYAADARLNPAGAYGRTKAAGERAIRAVAPHDHLIVRTAYLYGAGGPCFPKTMQRLARERGGVSVVDDQRGQPTWTRDVAALLERLVAARVPTGTYHATSSGEASWFDFACAVLGDDLVSPTTSDAFVRPAPRPAYSVLSHDTLHAAGVAPIGHWRDRWAEAAPEVLAAD